MRTLNVVVTGGGTIAPIDDVRQIANLSTGGFSAAISEAWLALGARVWHIHAPRALVPFERAARFDFECGDLESELERLRRLHERRSAVAERLRLVPLRDGTVSEYAEVLESTLRNEPIDVAMLAMAASDYEPVRSEGKIDSSSATLTIHCARARKVIASVRDWSPDVYLVGFKLTSGLPRERLVAVAEASRAANRADAVVANDVSTLRDGGHTVHLVRGGIGAETFGPGGPIAERLTARLLDLVRARVAAVGSIPSPSEPL